MPDESVPSCLGHIDLMNNYLCTICPARLDCIQKKRSEKNVEKSAVVQ
ncbi:MAG: hypothetical protein UY48_C0013G0023 [Candidatus Gottesmanbacteria bacterium GW2011_GWB1_49_7]|uniref:Uncharacterized protein n=1 Tax=Candidatus Gottesmanbacteria bacterium GW2011_GWB1_49_7 TaxID=1618448 RepID=A0A0G1YA12_9BACT|nr:MAG: hypothetical protein UY48_C0013G0023 [Candidatus Gottesmanbacteria bacterium GW2011_GWB1_49_7]